MHVSKKIQDLRRGLYGLFDKKFTFNHFEINPSLDDQGYHMDYLGSEYDMDFVPCENLRFELKVKLPKNYKYLEEKLKNGRVSNRRLDSTKYLADQTISVKGNIVDVSCRLKRAPKNDAETNKICDQLWTNVIKNVMNEVRLMK